MASNKLSSERAAALAAVRESEDAAFAHAVAAERAAEVAEGRRDDAVRLAEAAGEGRGRAYAHAGYVTGRPEAVDGVLGLAEGTAARWMKRWSREAVAQDALPPAERRVMVTVVKPRARPTAVGPVPVEDVAAAG